MALWTERPVGGMLLRLYPLLHLPMPCRVLIVDDNRAFADNVAEILELEGYESQVFDQPTSALDYAAQHPFDVAIVDIRMPQMDGVTLYGELVKRHPGATFLLMTAFTAKERLAEALAAGVKAVLPKPVDVDHLLGLLPPSAA